MFPIGPQVAIVDDKQGEIALLQDTLEELHVGSTFFKVDFTEPKYPEKPINTVGLVFLDLFYNPAYGAGFEPYMCIDWLKHIVPYGNQYILVIWTRDPDRQQELIDAMKDAQSQDNTFPYPTKIESKAKPDYQSSDSILQILSEVGIEYTDYTDVTGTSYDFYGQIIEIEESAFLINCLINEEPKVFEIRKFDFEPFCEFSESEKQEGSFVKISVTTKPGSRKFEFFAEPETENLYNLFKKIDPFADFEDFKLLFD